MTLSTLSDIAIKAAKRIERHYLNKSEGNIFMEIDNDLKFMGYCKIERNAIIREASNLHKLANGVRFNRKGYLLTNPDKIRILWKAKYPPKCCSGSTKCEIEKCKLR